MTSATAFENFHFESVGSDIAALETPVPLIDLDVVEKNVRRWQASCDAAGIANRPHIKTHKLVPLAKAQIAVGAKGISVQKLGEAEVMAAAGIRDMLLTFNVVGASKLTRLAALARTTDIAVVADSVEIVDGIAEAGAAAGRPIRVLVECDTGAGRNGVATPAAALALAQMISKRNAVRFGGLMTYPKPGTRAAAAAFFAEARALCEKAGLPVETITTGGSPDMWSNEGLGGVTEYRAGSYIYKDRTLLSHGNTVADCALTVLSTIVSRPAADRAIIDAGSKALTSDQLGQAGFGVVPALGDTLVSMIHEEHGFLDLSQLAESAKPRVGDTIRILPNHGCPVSNLFDKVVFVRGSQVLGALPVDARGKVQ